MCSSSTSFMALGIFRGYSDIKAVQKWQTMEKARIPCRDEIIFLMASIFAYT